MAVDINKLFVNIVNTAVDIIKVFVNIIKVLRDSCNSIADTSN